MNHLKTFALLAVMTALFMGLGYLIGGATGMAIALAVAAGMNLFSYWNADKIVLKMYRAQVVDETHPNAVVRAYVADVKQMVLSGEDFVVVDAKTGEDLSRSILLPAKGYSRCSSSIRRISARSDGEVGAGV